MKNNLTQDSSPLAPGGRFLALTLALSLFITGCGYKGELYLPREGDETQFGPIQTGIGIDAAPKVTPKAPAKAAPAGAKQSRDNKTITHDKSL